MMTMVYSRHIFLALLSACFLIAGCTDDLQSGNSDTVAGKVQNKATRSVTKVNYLPSPINPAIKPQDAILRINGKDITRAEYDLLFRTREKSFRRANGASLGVKDDKVRRYMASCRHELIGVFIRRELLRQAAAKKGLEPTDESFSAIASRFLRYIRVPSQNLDGALASVFTPEEAAFLRDGMECDALGEVYLRSWSTNDLDHVSDVEASNRVARILAVNEKTRALNAEARRKAAAAKAEILSGAKFYDVTTNRCELVPEQGMEWETFELGELEPTEDLCKFLTTANQGDISDPLDFDDGIGIVGVVVKEMGEAPEGYVPAEQYTLVRCLFRAYDLLDVPEDLDEVRQQILDERRAAARTALGEELMKAAVIEYPAGEQIFRKKAKKGKKKSANRPVQVNKPVDKGN